MILCLRVIALCLGILVEINGVLANNSTVELRPKRQVQPTSHEPCPDSCPYQAGFYSLAFNGDRISSLVGFLSADSCRIACQENPDCVGFSFYDQRCETFSQISSYLIVRQAISGLNQVPLVEVADNSNAGIRHPACGLRGKSFKGQILANGVLHSGKDSIQTAAECQWACQKVDECWYFSKEQDYCYLLANQGRATNQIGVTSGPKVCGQGPPPTTTMPPVMTHPPTTTPRAPDPTTFAARRSSISWRDRAGQFNLGTAWPGARSQYTWQW